MADQHISKDPANEGKQPDDHMRSPTARQQNDETASTEQPLPRLGRRASLSRTSQKTPQDPAEAPMTSAKSSQASSRFSMSSVLKHPAQSGTLIADEADSKYRQSNLERIGEFDFHVDSTDSNSSEDDDTPSFPDRHTVTTAPSTYGRDSAISNGMTIKEPVLDTAQIEWSFPHDAMSEQGSLRAREGLGRSTTSMSDIHSSRASSRPSRARKMPEFFSLAVFEAALSSPTISHQLLEFSHSRLRGENMDFLARVQRYNASLEEVIRAIYEIHGDFFAKNASMPVALPESVLQKTSEEMRKLLTTNIPILENLFTNASSVIEHFVFKEVYPGFVRHQMSVSAAKALGGDRSKYAGLGDCFVLTDPSRADNPIVFASDGFVSVTGYSRNEIIPRNCRFLQKPNSDRAAVRRLKMAIDKRQESVELLLNYKKNGEPFWNLLYVTPLFDGYGNVAFFLGGQINCSTTIHNTSDVLRILGQTKQVDANAVPGPNPVPELSLSQRGRDFLDKFRNFNKPGPRQALQEPGMENRLLQRMEEMSLQDQMQQFHRAYSKYIIINHTTSLIAFISAGLIDYLFAIKTRNAYHPQAVGTDVFKFLGNHSTGSLGSDYKSAVKRSLRMGQPVTLELKLCAKPSMGLEKFNTYWTPLKDAAGVVMWVVLTLGNEQRAG